MAKRGTKIITLRLDDDLAQRADRLTERLPGLARSVIIRLLLGEQLRKDLDEQVALVVRLIQAPSTDIEATESPAEPPVPKNRLHGLNTTPRKKRRRTG